ncbi:geranylgeranyl diphosphate synthase, type I [Actinomadura meyerae]|jgi:geranylgeranyl diphosphate synthase type I|uniref:Geranylgeranyl diphosphate synthase, type I n=1 Tax=Actinomadura meyerae TaxID=240840 RepID=A0A239CCM8_9ACTN|nr:polyprenyl synthetase family protein [Actinomadura meyerae]SNS17996.1 geranylgeranyl diphosphate synthase, type I [Actinomadura meyerae]
MSTSRIRKEVDEALLGFVDRQRPALLTISDDLGPLLSALDALLGGGKRLRPAFCYWGWRAAGGEDSPGIVAAAASLELLQASALVHDDVMDSSDTRRGQPSAHRRFEALHRAQGWPGDAEAFGGGAAILLGDLCLAWSSEMFETCGLDAGPRRRGRAVYDLMRTEVMCGQYLDMLEGTRGRATVETALRVVEYKSAKYTIERPLHLGAVLAGARPDVTAALTGYGLPLGIAFQLRDDVLGVFGDPAETGKPAGDDLREGKRTVLIALTLERATAAQAAAVRRRLGDPALDRPGVDELRTIIEETGGLAACEAMIERYLREAEDSLRAAPVTAEAREALGELAVAATTRST